MLAVTRYDVLVTLHVLAVVAAFGGAIAYPLWFRMIRDGTPEQRAFFHGAQARLGKFLIMPAILVIFATGSYLASDLDLWSEGWVLIPTGMLVPFSSSAPRSSGQARNGSRSTPSTRIDARTTSSSAASS